MNKRDVVRFSFWVFNFLIVALLIWSLINYKVFNQEVSDLIEIWGIIAMILFVIILEGAPVFVGPSVAVASVLAIGTNPWLVLILFLISAFVGNAFYYYLGHVSGKKILKYFDEEDVKKYKKFFKNHGGKTMAVMAVSPIPYLPTLAGVFKLKSKKIISNILLLRAVRHIIVFIFWVIIVGVI